ncbi:MAG: NPCBM/NEW2 domain-containing protein [Planctomycetaceae bacterium]|nr:NPCBM/NEW2 domain-containing protein [Planctomycetaceae bacterium]
MRSTLSGENSPSLGIQHVETRQGEKDQKADEQIFLSDLAPAWVNTFTSANWGFGSNGFSGERRNGELVEILVNGKTFQHSLGTHPRVREGSCVVYDIKGRFKTLAGAVALSDQSGRVRTPITFEIRGDGKRLWQSNAIKSSGKLESFKVDVQKVHRLELVVNCPGSNHSAGAVWLEPVLTHRN